LTDSEYEILDELYFVLSFEELKSKFSYPEKELVGMLKRLLEKGWVRCLTPVTDVEIEDFSEFDHQYTEYNYLASKKGLLAHNSI
jgi:hypothetical protein